jgi:hypothetical protein
MLLHATVSSTVYSRALESEIRLVKRPQEENGCGEALEMDERFFSVSLTAMAVRKAAVNGMMEQTH